VRPLPRTIAGSLVVCSLLAGLLIQAEPASAGATLPGIDVSAWQGNINWAKVAGAGTRFAILKATEGASWNDPTYAANVAGAATNGITVGAYHFADPSSAPGDAVSEADHFVSIAKNSPGDIVPALDIEHKGNLSTAGLVAWVKTWLAEVASKLGVKPMLYASPGFWKYSMGDTTWFADNGYQILWVAHWGVTSPDVPANDWGGNGWTFWQWTDCRHVAGISGCVDGDKFNGTNLIEAEIAKLVVTPNGGGSVSGASIDCGGGGNDCSRLATPTSTTTLTATPSGGASLMGWTGACSGAGNSLTCDVKALGVRHVSAVFGFPVTVSVGGSGAGSISSSPQGISCGANCGGDFAFGTSVSLSAQPDSASGIGSWSGACSGSSATCSFTVKSAISASVSFDAAETLDAAAPGTRFTWGVTRDPRAIGGRYLVEHRAGSSAGFSFTGGSVTLSTIAGPGMGKAKILIDGDAVGTFSGYARSFAAGVEHRFTNLGAGAHTLTVVALGTKALASKGTRVGVDAFKAGGVLHPNPSGA
jgi:lysozyme